MNREKAPKKNKNAFAHYLNWKNSFIANVLSDFIAKQGTIYKACFHYF